MALEETRERKRKGGARCARHLGARMAVVTGWILMLSGPAYAQSCSSDADCDDGIPCTDDVCFGVQRTCIHIDNCPDSDFCNGVETCCTNAAGCGTTAFGACVPGGDPCPDQVCNEQNDRCDDCNSSTQCSDNNPCTSDTCNTSTGLCEHSPRIGESCTDGKPCTLADTCQETESGVECVGTPIDCNADAPVCQQGVCINGTCSFSPEPDGTACEADEDPCTSQVCISGQCVERPPACIDLELRGPISGTIKKGDLVRLELWARNNDCPSPPPGLCETTLGQPVSGAEIVVAWDESALELVQPDPVVDCPETSGPDNNNNGIPDVCDNPSDPCVSLDPCVLNCGQVTQYNWLGAGTTFPQDCTNSNLNAPCPGFPANDGDVFLANFKQLTCNQEPAPPACVGSGGLLITRLRFKGKAVTSGLGPPAQVGIATCGGTRPTQVVGGVPGEDVTGVLASPVELVVECSSSEDCPDQRPCIDGACGQLPPPTVSVAGPRYLEVTPAAGAQPVALLVRGAEAAVSCVSAYVQSNGTLGPTPFYQVPGPEGWDTVFVRGGDVIWGRNYTVQGDFNSSEPGTSLSTEISVKTWARGDVDNSGLPVSILDVTRILDAFRSIFNSQTACTTDADCTKLPPNFKCNTDSGRCIWVTIQNTDLVSTETCVPDGIVSIVDVLGAIDAFRGIPDVCAVNCP